MLCRCRLPLLLLQGTWNKIHRELLAANRRRPHCPQALPVVGLGQGCCGTQRILGMAVGLGTPAVHAQLSMWAAREMAGGVSGPKLLSMLASLMMLCTSAVSCNKGCGCGVGVSLGAGLGVE